MLCAAYSRPQEETRYSILWKQLQLKRSSNNLWQLKKVVKADQRVARRPAAAARKAAAARRLARRPARRSSNSVRQPTTATFHRRTQHTWPLEAILKGTANASTKPAVPFFFCLRRSAHLVMLTNHGFEFRATSFEFNDLSQLETQSER